MQLSSAQAIQNRGTFHAADTALKSGNSSSERHSGGETYMAFQHADSMHFQRYQAQPVATSSEDRFMAVLQMLLSLDTRVYTSLVVSILFTTVFHAIFEVFPLISVAVGMAFFFVWYVMSFFDFKRLAHTLSYGAAA